MPVINQPRASQLGTTLSHFLMTTQHCDASTFYIVSAYAKRSAVDRIEHSIQQFRQRGGTLIAIIGVDQRVTTIQALEKLHAIADQLYVYHSESFSQTFHPKLYVIENPPSRAIVFIGSSNLTSGGLYSNYEATYQKEYNLLSEDDSAEFSQLKQMIESYKDTSSPCSKLITGAILDQLIDQGYLSNEQVTINIQATPTPTPGTAHPEPLFGTERFTPPPVSVTRLRPHAAGGAELSLPRLSTQGFWKKLSKNDVSRSSSPGQIIIPKTFSRLFPSLPAPQTTSANAGQAEAFFNVIFISALGATLRIDGVRLIHYVPAPTHPRPNPDFRFTFRNRDVFEHLEARDILEFRRTHDPDIWFQITQRKPGASQYRRLSARGRFGFVSR